MPSIVLGSNRARVVTGPLLSQRAGQTRNMRKLSKNSYFIYLDTPEHAGILVKLIQVGGGNK